MTEVPEEIVETADVNEVRAALGLAPEPPSPSYNLSLAAARPMLDRLLLRVIPDAMFTQGGLEIPDVARDRPLQALVLAVGPGKALDNGRWLPMGVKVGDVVLFQKFGGAKVRIDGEELLMLRQDEIMCVFEQPTSPLSRVTETVGFYPGGHTYLPRSVSEE